MIGPEFSILLQFDRFEFANTRQGKFLVQLLLDKPCNLQ